jgi:hypothetical protein
MIKPQKKRAPRQIYSSTRELTLPGFETPFAQKLDPSNRWVVLAKLIPWDEITSLYLRQVGVSRTGCPPLSPRIVLGSLIIKHICDLDDRETVQQISENVYMQYFIGYSSFSTEAPFDASLFVDFRKRLGMEQVNELNEKIIQLKTRMEETIRDKNKSAGDSPNNESDGTDAKSNSKSENKDIQSDTAPITHKGRVIFDATACPQDIAFPTDLNLLSDARQKSEELIDKIYKPELYSKKPRTYRQKARKLYLKTAQNKNKSRKTIYKAVGQQLRFLKRNIRIINEMLDTCTEFPLTAKEHRYLLIITTLYYQQNQMHRNRSHTIEHRIVSIHQPHIRPIVRGKSQAKTEFGAKIHLSLIDGISFLDELSWDAFNEGGHMMEYIKKYRERFGFYPRQVLADKIYCTRENRNALKTLGIELRAKPLGRPKAVPNHVSPGERNPIEGKFGQAKTAYGLGRIRARLKQTSQTWIACIILVLNLVTLAGAAAYCPIRKVYQQVVAWETVWKRLTQLEIKTAGKYFLSAV